MPETRFYDLFEKQIKENKSKLLFQKRDGWSWKQITWLDFQTEVRSISSFLMDFGFEKGDRVLVISSNSLECLNVELSVYLLGGCTVPLSTEFEMSDLEYILKKEKIKYVFIEDEKVLAKTEKKLVSKRGIKKIFVLSDYKSKIEDKIVNYKSLVKFGFMKAKKLKDELKEFNESVEPDTAAISFYDFSGEKPKNKVLTQEVFLDLLQHAYKKMRFVTADDQSYSYLTSSNSFSKLVNYFTIFIGSIAAIAENKKDFFSDVLEVMPTVMFLTSDGMERSVDHLSKTNGTHALKKSFGGRLKYVITDSEPANNVKNAFVGSGISVIELPELASLSS